MVAHPIRYYAGTDGKTVWFRGTKSFAFASVGPRNPGWKTPSFSKNPPSGAMRPCFEIAKSDYDALKRIQRGRYDAVGQSMEHAGSSDAWLPFEALGEELQRLVQTGGR